MLFRFTIAGVVVGRTNTDGNGFCRLADRVSWLSLRYTSFACYASFPLSFLCLLIPLPGFLLDFIIKRVQPMTFKVATSLLVASGFQAEVLPEGNPVQIFRDEEQRNIIYEMYSGTAGLGLPGTADLSCRRSVVSVAD